LLREYLPSWEGDSINIQKWARHLPPCTLHLAPYTRKLKAEFRQGLGITGLGYLHDCRMEKSRQLLEAGELSIAFNNRNDTTGSQSPTAFSSAIGLLYRSIDPLALYASYS